MGTVTPDNSLAYRKVRNREHARKTRLRKKFKIQTLQTRCGILENENSMVKEECKKICDEVSRLKTLMMQVLMY